MATSIPAPAVNRAAGPVARAPRRQAGAPDRRRDHWRHGRRDHRWSRAVRPPAEAAARALTRVWIAALSPWTRAPMRRRRWGRRCGARTSASTTTPAPATRARSRWPPARTGWCSPAGWTSRSTRVCAFSFSTDGGLTWSKNVSIPNNTGMFVGDPAVAIDGGGTMYAVCQEYLNVGVTGNIRMMTSTDRGVTWSAIQTIQSAPDKPWAGGGTADGTLFVSWLGNAAGIKRSLDHGVTWGPIQSLGNIIHGTGITRVDHAASCTCRTTSIRRATSCATCAARTTARPTTRPAISLPTWARSASPAARASTRSSARRRIRPGKYGGDHLDQHDAGRAGRRRRLAAVLERRRRHLDQADPRERQHGGVAPVRVVGRRSTRTGACTSPGPTCATAGRTRRGTRARPTRPRASRPNIQVTDGHGSATASFLGDYKGIVVQGPDVLVVWQDTRRDSGDIYFSRAAGAAGP